MRIEVSSRKEQRVFAYFALKTLRNFTKARKNYFFAKRKLFTLGLFSYPKEFNILLDNQVDAAQFLHMLPLWNKSSAIFSF